MCYPKMLFFIINALNCDTSYHDVDLLLRLMAASFFQLSSCMKYLSGSCPFLCRGFISRISATTVHLPCTEINIIILILIGSLLEVYMHCRSHDKTAIQYLKFYILYWNCIIWKMYGQEKCILITKIHESFQIYIQASIWRRVRYWKLPLWRRRCTRLPLCPQW